MAASAIFSRLSARSLSLALRLRKNAISPAVSPLKSNYQSPVSNSKRRVPGISSLGSMMPLHSAIASARLTSVLSVESQSWGLIPQGISMPL